MSAPVEERLGRLLERCEICEHRCGVDRRVARGVCGLPTEARYYRAFVHHGEEPEISPTVAVFLTGCSFRCAFCSDGAFVERPGAGERLVPRELAALVDRLSPSARTVSFVGGNPDENMVPLLATVREMRSGLPVVWNSNLYLSPEPLEEVVEAAHVFVADLKFGNDACARELARAPRYLEVLHRNLASVHGRRRLIVRHLLMPGHLACCTLPVIEHVARHLPSATLNVLTQYEPLFAAFALPVAMARRITKDEIDGAVAAARSRGVASLWRDGRDPGEDGRAPREVALPRPSGVPFEARIVVRGDGRVVVEHAGEGLEGLEALLAPADPPRGGARDGADRAPGPLQAERRV